MLKRFGLFLLALFLCANAVATSPQDLTLKADDGVTVYGKLYSAEHPKAIILLFHQAGSNSSEYAPIAPKLNEMGFTALAIDQRSGDNMFGYANQTAKHLGHAASYLDAQKDLEAAFSYAKEQHLPIVLWGSSYSSSLVFLVAARHPGEVKALLSFSPGEYLGSPDLVKKAAAQDNLPIFVTQAKDKEEIDKAKAIFAASPAAFKVQFIPAVAGVHGSSTLRSDRNAQGAAENWQAVTAFLNKVFP